MPILTAAEAERGLTLAPTHLPDDPAPPPAPAALDTVGAAFRQANSIGSAVGYGVDLPADAPGAPGAFDPFDGLDEVYRPFAAAFVDAESPADAERIKRRIDWEQEDRRTLSAAGTAGIAATVAAGLLDPINLLPLGAGAAAVRGAGAGTRIALGAAAAGVGATAQEATLHATQDTRTGEETLASLGGALVFGGAVGGALGAGSRAANTARGAAAGAAAGGATETARQMIAGPTDSPLESVGVAALLTGILGGAMGAVHGNWHALEDAARRDLSSAHPAPDPVMPEAAGRTDATPPPGPAPGPTDGIGNAGAAVSNAPVADERIASALGVEKGIRWASPMLRLATSPSVVARRIAQDLIETPYLYDKNALGVPTPTAVETRVKMWNAPLAEALQGLEDAFVHYRTGQAGGSLLAVQAGDLTGAARRAGRMTFDQFRQAVGQAMRRGDAHPVPEVAEAARLMRARLFDPLKDAAVEAGLLPDGVTPDTAPSYLTRVYNTRLIAARRSEFVRTVTGWLTGQRDGAAQRMGEHHEKATLFRTQAEKERQQVTDTSAELTRAQAALNRLRSDRRAAVNEHRRAERAVTAAEAGTPAFADFMRDVRRGRPAGKPPLTLASWLVRKGGLLDQGGEVRALGIDHKTRPGLLNSRGGMPLDEAARAAGEAGYIGVPGERPDIQELLDALQADVSGRGPVLRDADLDHPLRQQDIDAFRRSLDEQGIDLASLSDAELEARIAVEFEGPITDAQARQAEIGAALATDRRAQARQRRDVAAGRLEAIRAKVAAAKSRRDEMALWLENRKSALSDSEQGAARAERAVADTAVLSRADDMELEDIAQQITDRILGHPDGRIPYDAVPLARGPLRERTFAIPDALIEPYLESDVGLIARFYTRTMAPDVELAARFGRADLAGQIAKVHEDYTARTRTAPDEAALQKLEAQRRADVRDLEAMRDRIRGTFAAPAHPDSLLNRAVPLIANWNYVATLGGMAVSSIPDLHRAVAVHGLTRTFRDGLLPLLRNLSAFRAGAEEVKRAGTALDMVLNSRALSLADIGDAYGRHSRFERGVQAVADRFGAIALMAPWNAAMKQFAGVVTVAGLLDDVAALSAGSSARRAVTRLAAAGIGREMVERIAAQARHHGETVDGVRLPHTERWTDRAAVDAFRAAVVREVDSTINTPSAGTSPLWMSHPVGKLVGQFKSFGFAAAQQIVIAGLQRRDAATLNGFVLAVGLGMLTYAVKAGLAGRPLPEDPAEWIARGIDQSGVTGWLFDVVNLASKATRGQVSIEALTSGEPAGRYMGQSPLEAFAGPAAARMTDVLRVTGAAATGDPSRGDVSAARRLLPFQNLFYLRTLFDEAEAGVAEALGLPADR